MSKGGRPHQGDLLQGEAAATAPRRDRPVLALARERLAGDALLAVGVLVEERRAKGLDLADPPKGSIMPRPAFSKSARFRVTTVRPWTRAVAAMRLSLMA
jgi:hypothetical protein